MQYENTISCLIKGVYMADSEKMIEKYTAVHKAG